MAWTRVASLADLRAKGRLLVKPNGRQIALFEQDGAVYACNNRCPHEGYPLVEGSLAAGCVLTCNWHNWKFDLRDGRTLMGGDALRVYPSEVRDGEIWLDLTDPPAEQVVEQALAGLRESFRRREEGRMAREVARIRRAGGDPLTAVRCAVHWTHDRLEFGTSHAYAATADWLRLRERDARSEGERLVPVVESLVHMADDTLREPAYPYADGEDAYDEAAFLAAIEAEDEAAAVARLRGALAGGHGFESLAGAFARAALAHYQGFGHAAIYVIKTGELVAALGREVEAPLLLALTRYLVHTRREDLIPEFRAYAPAVRAWRAGDAPPPPSDDFIAGSVKGILGRIAAAQADPAALYRTLLQAAARQMLLFDAGRQNRTSGPISQNADWLDLTHAITFANAGRRLAERDPGLWPAVLLQIGCFLGRNAGFLDRSQDAAAWRVDRPEAFLAEARRGLFDHREREPIVGAHLVKLLTAVSEEVEAAPDAAHAPDLAAAANRLLHSPLRRKHPLRTANQALAFVAAEA